VERGAEKVMKIEDSIRRKTGNRLLAAMPAGVWEDLKPHLELVELASGHVLCTSGKPLTEIHFPLTGTIVAVLVILRDGPAVEATIIGREGVVGGIVSGPPSFARATAQVPGWSARIAATAHPNCAISSLGTRTLCSPRSFNPWSVMRFIRCNSVLRVGS
jgi:hypothetical protein